VAWTSIRSDDSLRESFELACVVQINESSLIMSIDKKKRKKEKLPSHKERLASQASFQCSEPNNHSTESSASKILLGKSTNSITMKVKYLILHFHLNLDSAE
jgi:hypothetical protein